MSKQNVEVVRRVLDDWARGDDESWLGAFDRAVEGDFTQMPDGRATKGRAELRREVSRWKWPDLETQTEDVFDAGDEVVVCVRQTGVVPVTGLRTETRYAQAFVLRNGKIVRMTTYWELERALAAVGLLE